MWNPLVELLRLIRDPMTLLTFGLLVFAAAQVWVAHRGELRQRAERQADEETERQRVGRDLDEAFHVVWAEHFRIDSVAARWEKLDFVFESVRGVLRPDEVLLRDWSLILQRSARLGPEAAFLAALASNVSFDLERQLIDFNRTVAELAVASQAQHWAGRAEHVRASVSPVRLKFAEDKLRQAVPELSLLLWDVVSHSPRGDLHRTLRFRDELGSRMAKDAVAALVERSATASTNITDDERRGTEVEQHGPSARSV